MTHLEKGGTRAAMSALAGAMLLASLGTSIVTVALPALTREFDASVSATRWVILAYLTAVTVSIVLAGKLADRYGHRTVLLAGLAVFTAASALATVAPGLGALIAARALQGTGAAVLMALPFSIMKEAVPRERIGSAIGMLGTMSAIGTALGPSAGGVMMSLYGWRSAFLAMTVIGIAVTLLSAAVLPRGKAHAGGSARMDRAGAVLLTVTLAAYALATSGGKGGFSAGSGLLLAGAAIGLALFVLVEIRAAAPLVPVSLLVHPPVRNALATNMMVTIVMMSTLVVGPFFLAFGLGLPEVTIGLVMAVGPLMSALSGFLAGRASDRFGTGPVLVAGLVEIMAGLLAFALLPGLAGTAGYVLALIILTPGFQLFLAANGSALMGQAPDSERGVLAGLLGLSRNLGFMTGASLMTTLFTLALGTADIAHAAPQAIAAAFCITFLVAVGLVALALAIQLSARHPATREKLQLR